MSPRSALTPGRGRLLLALSLLLAVGAPLAPWRPAARAESRAPPAAAPARDGTPARWMPERPVPPLRMPVTGPVVRGFELRAGPYGPGHRGIDIAAEKAQPVRAPAAGAVAFAGPVAGTTWVSIEVAPGVVVTVGPLLDPAVTRGRRVRALAPVGRLGPGHPLPPGWDGPGGPAGPAGAGGRVALHLSVRVDGQYVDPLPYLVDRPRPRLAPLLAPGGLDRP